MPSPARYRRIEALVFDFDGLILDTETPVFEAWRVVYAESGHELSLDRWQHSIGTDGSGFDPLTELRRLVGRPLDRAALTRRRREIRDRDLALRSALPGVESALSQARAIGLKVAIASSSPADWVVPHLERLGLAARFDAIATRDHVADAKPAPDLYLLATAQLGVDPAQAIAFEDSPNGVASAKAAGLYCVAVPGPMTAALCFDHADAKIHSLSARTIAAWIREAERPDRRLSVSIRPRPGNG